MSPPPIPAPILATPRLLLRPLVAADSTGLHEAYGDGEAMRFWDLPPSRNRAETAVRIGWSLAASADWHAAWAIVRRADGRVLGLVNYHHREAWHRRLEIGYILARAHWRQGFMGEALPVFLDHCFGALATHRVEAMIEPGNIASLRLAEKLGFRREGGQLRDRLYVAGHYRSLLVYGLLATDRRAARPRMAMGMGGEECDASPTSRS